MSQNSIGDPFYGTANMISGKYYRASVNYSEFEDIAYLSLSWNIDQNRYAYIPSSNMYSPEYISPSPYQITIICLPGYDIRSSLEAWVPIWGDGLRLGSEKWDDGNNLDGDGCKGDCSAIEPSWDCSGGSMTSKDVWHYDLVGNLI